MKSFLDTHNIPYSANQDLKKVTWIHRGGVATWYIVPNTIDQLSKVYVQCKRQGILPIVVGHTSNMYFKNTCNVDVVISTKKIQNISIDGDEVVAECGAHIKKIAKACVVAGLRGLEGLVNLPGTAAAAVINNAGCYGCLAAEYLVKCEVMNPDGTVGVLLKNDLCFSHRSSIFKRKEKDACILRVFWKLPTVERTLLEKKAEEVTFNRMRTQEGPANNLGSTFCDIRPNRFYKTIIRIASLANKCYQLFDKRSGTVASIVAQNRINRYIRNMLLYLTGNSNLKKYVSQYNIICFIWRDEYADEAFKQYNEFVRRISTSSTLEIEVFE